VLVRVSAHATSLCSAALPLPKASSCLTQAGLCVLLGQDLPESRQCCPSSSGKWSCACESRLQFSVSASVCHTHTSCARHTVLTKHKHTNRENWCGPNHSVFYSCFGVCSTPCVALLSAVLSRTSTVSARCQACICALRQQCLPREAAQSIEADTIHWQPAVVHAPVTAPQTAPPAASASCTGCGSRTRGSVSRLCASARSRRHTRRRCRTPQGLLVHTAASLAAHSLQSPHSV